MENNLYSVIGINPMRHFLGNETKSSFTYEELQNFYFAHYPEKETCSLDDIKSMFKELGSELQLAKVEGE